MAEKKARCPKGTHRNKKSGNCETKKVKRRSSRNEDNECPICYEHMTARNSVKTKCNHTFHKKCLKQQCDINPTCPLCRKDITAFCNEDKDNNTLYPNGLTKQDIEKLSIVFDQYDISIPGELDKSTKEYSYLKTKLKSIKYDESYNDEISDNIKAYAHNLKANVNPIFVQALDKVSKFRQGQKDIFRVKRRA